MNKKKIGIILCIVLVLILVYQVNNKKDPYIELDKSERHSQQDIKQAMECVRSEINSWKGYRITKIWFDDEKSLKGEKEWKKEITSKDEKEIIILYTNFKTGLFSFKDGFEPFTNINSYEWVLIKNEETNKWEVYSFGYD